MRTVDLFTGIGGFARALRGISTPLLYCDIDEKVRNTLTTLMRKRRLPRAKIVNNVRNIDEIRRIVGEECVDIIVASVPCIGFSRYGRREGLLNEHTRLFFDTIEIVRLLRPRLIFFENVADILNVNGGRDMGELCQIITSLGYTMRWTIVTASDAGAPQFRRRWFCLCVHTDAGAFPDLPRSGSSRHWDPRRRPPITAPHSETTRKMRQLGNALVPQSARLAFYRLYAGFGAGVAFNSDCRFHDDGACVDIATSSGDVKLPKHAFVSESGVIRRCVAPTMHVVPGCNILVDPSQYRTRRTYVEHPARPQRSPLITAPLLRPSWPTPRVNSVTHSSNLSERTLRDLPTVAMFCSSVDGEMVQPTDDGDRLNVRFVCWLMGFPPTYLDGT